MPILSPSQAAAVRAVICATNKVDGAMDRAFFGTDGQGFIFASCPHGAVKVWVSHGRSGHGNELRSELHRTQGEFAAAYNLPTDGLIPF